MKYEIIAVSAHDEDTGKALGKPEKINKMFASQTEIETYRKEVKKQKDNGHTVQVYFQVKQIPEKEPCNCGD